MAPIIPEQRTAIFVGEPFEMSVEKTNSKIYTYMLYKEDTIIERWSGDKAPIAMNKNSAFINDSCKKIGDIKVDYDGTTFTMDKSQVKDKLMNALATLDALCDGYMENKFENDLKDKEKKETEEEELLGKRFDEFSDFLIEHNMTLNQFLFYAAEWLAAGEDHNILKGMFCHLSTYFLIKPIWFLPLGKSGEGKSVIDESAVKMLPKEVFENGRVSESALHRKSKKDGENYLDGKVMRMRDMGGDRDFEKWSDTIDRYKELSTEGEVEVEKVGDGIDPATGERKVISFKLTGHCSCCITSVNSEGFDDQILSRGIDVTPQATNEQVKMFAKYNHGTVASHRDWVIKNHIGLFHDYVKYVKRYIVPETKVINPYWECLEEWFKESEFYKRNLSTYTALVETVTLLNADWRMKVYDDHNQTYVVSTREDNRLIGGLFNPSQGLTANATKVFNLLIRWYGNYNPNNLEGRYSEKKVMEEWEDYHEASRSLKDCDTLFNIANVKRRASRTSANYKNLPFSDIIQSLVNNGFVRVMGKMNRSNNNVYALDHWEPLGERSIVFDDNCISQYVADMSSVYGVPHDLLWEIVDTEKIENGGEPINSDIKLPPWVSEIWKGVSKGG